MTTRSSRGFHEQFLGEDRPPVTHYQLGGDVSGFYVEFLTPLVGSEFRRGGTSDVTVPIAGVFAQKLRYLDVLLIAPWSAPLHHGGESTKVNISNPVSYIAQKLLIGGKRKQSERAKDVLYIHDTLELFGRSIPHLRTVWLDDVRPRLGQRSEAKLRQAAQRSFTEVTDIMRRAALMATGRVSPHSLVETCRVALYQLFRSLEHQVEGT